MERSGSPLEVTLKARWFWESVLLDTSGASVIKELSGHMPLPKEIPRLNQLSTFRRFVDACSTRPFSHHHAEKAERALEEFEATLHARPDGPIHCRGLEQPMIYDNNDLVPYLSALKARLSKWSEERKPACNVPPDQVQSAFHAFGKKARSAFRPPILDAMVQASRHCEAGGPLPDDLNLKIDRKLVEFKEELNLEKKFADSKERIFLGMLARLSSPKHVNSFQGGNDDEVAPSDDNEREGRRHTSPHLTPNAFASEALPRVRCCCMHQRKYANWFSFRSFP